MGDYNKFIYVHLCTVKRNERNEGLGM